MSVQKIAAPKEDFPDSFNRWLLVSLQKWKNGPKSDDGVPAINDFKDWLHNVLASWKADIKAVDELTPTNMTLSRSFEATVDRLEQGVRSSSINVYPSTFLEGVERALYAMVTNVEPNDQEVKMSEMSLEEIDRAKSTFKSFLGQLQDYEDLEDNHPLKNLMWENIKSELDKTFSEDRERGGVFIPSSKIREEYSKSSSINEYRAVLRTVLEEFPGRYMDAMTPKLIAEALEETVAPVLQTWRKDANTAREKTKPIENSRDSLNDWAAKALPLVMQDETFSKQASVTSNDFAAYLASSAERYRLIIETGKDPDEYSLKSQLIRSFESLAYNADLHAAYAKGMIQTSNGRHGSPCRVWESLNFQSRGMLSMSGSLELPKAGSITAIQFGKLKAALSNWLDEYWSLLNELTNSMRNKPGVRSTWAKFIDSPSYTEYDKDKKAVATIMDGQTVDYKEAISSNGHEFVILTEKITRFWEAGKANGTVSEQDLNKIKEWLQTTIAKIVDADKAIQGS